MEFSIPVKKGGGYEKVNLNRLYPYIGFNV